MNCGRKGTRSGRWSDVRLLNDDRRRAHVGDIEHRPDNGFPLALRVCHEIHKLHAVLPAHFLVALGDQSLQPFDCWAVRVAQCLQYWRNILASLHNIRVLDDFQLLNHPYLLPQ